MRIHWNRAVTASVLSMGCLTLAFMPQVAASASTGAADTSSVLTWSAPLPAQTPSQGPINAVSCPSKKFCAAINYFNQVLTYNGKKWSTPVSVAVGGFTAITYNGKKWSAPAVIDSGANGLAAVSCASSAFCVAVDGNGQATVFNGSTWSAPSVVDPGYSLSAVSCPTTTFCAAVDDYGNAVGYNGTTWTAPVRIDIAALAAISCASSTFCVSVDNDSDVIQTPGAAIGTVQDVDNIYPFLTAVSCPTTTFCVAMDGVADYMVGSS